MDAAPIKVHALQKRCECRGSLAIGRAPRELRLALEDPHAEAGHEGPLDLAGPRLRKPDTGADCAQIDLRAERSVARGLAKSCAHLRERRQLVEGGEDVRSQGLH